ILQRRPEPADVVGEVRFGIFRFDLARAELFRGGDTVHLTTAETGLLASLAQQAGQPVSREELSQSAAFSGNIRNVDVQMTLLRHASGMTGLDFTFERGAVLPPEIAASGTILEKQLNRALSRRVQRPFRIDELSCDRCVLVAVQLRDGVLTVNIPRGRLYTATTYIFFLWMVGSSVVLLAIATIFLRNQVK